MNAPAKITAAKSNLRDRAAEAHRNLRKASKHDNVAGRRAKVILGKLSAVLELDESNIIDGPHSDLSALAWFLRQWTPAIEMECRQAERGAADRKLREGHKAYEQHFGRGRR